MKNQRSITVVLLLGLMIFILEAERKLMKKALPFINEISVIDNPIEGCCYEGIASSSLQDID
jgi:hypothetical protein